MSLLVILIKTKMQVMFCASFEKGRKMKNGENKLIRGLKFVEYFFRDGVEERQGIQYVS